MCVLRQARAKADSGDTSLTRVLPVALTVSDMSKAQSPLKRNAAGNDAHTGKVCVCVCVCECVYVVYV